MQVTVNKLIKTI